MRTIVEALPWPSEKRVRDRLRRHAQTDARLAAGHRIEDAIGSRQNQSQRSGPECAGQSARASTRVVNSPSFMPQPQAERCWRHRKLRSN